MEIGNNWMKDFYFKSYKHDSDVFEVMLK